MTLEVDIACDGALTERAAALLAERWGVPGDTRVRLECDPALPPESFRIVGEGHGQMTIAGGNARGLIYGVGKALRDPAWRGISVPECPVRGMYFASHFGNFYATAPIEQVERYVEDLALWGCNALAVWFDMHTYAGIDDPAARQMIERLRRLLKAANSVGIRGGLTTLANEGYANSPEMLRADWTAGHDGYTSPPAGHYQREICPSKPGGLDLIRAKRREMLEAFADLDIAYVWIWPYDQGGCTCGACAPWGAHGFLRTAESVAGVIHKVLPAAQIVLSAWYFDHFTAGEWEGLTRAFSDGAPHWVDWLMAGDYGSSFPQYLMEHGAPGGLPVLSFPEISMEGNMPWGGYGMNPRPATWETYQQRYGSLLSGCFPYSEGIYEDLNKVLLLQMNWDSQRPALDIVHEYAAWAFAAEIAPEVVEIVKRMEAGLGHTLVEDLSALLLSPRVQGPDDLRGRRLYQKQAGPDAQETLARVEAIGAQLPLEVRRGWRWQLLWLRAAIDAELDRYGGASIDTLDASMEALATIYATGEDALLAVTPPTRRALLRFARSQGV